MPRVLAINPCLRPESPRYILPVGLGYILTSLRANGIDFDLLDLDLDRPDDASLADHLHDHRYDIYLLGAIVTGYREIRKIARLIRDANPDAWIIAGNSVASSIPERLLRRSEVDVAVFGEGDETVVRLVEARRGRTELADVPGIAVLDSAGAYRRNLEMPVIGDLDALPLIDWDIFDVERYNARSAVLTNEPCPIPFEQRVSMQVNTARGCPFRCSFCYTVYFDEHFGARNRYRMRSPASLVHEIRELTRRYGLNYVNFWDDLTFPNWRIAERYVDAMLEADLGIHWNATTRGGLLGRKHKHVAEKMKAAGCVGLSYSLESANDEIRQNAINKILPLETFLEQKAVLDEVGISTWTNIIVGYPQETEETLRETLDFCYDHDIFPSTGYLLPMPGTAVWEKALRSGRIPDVEHFLMTFGDRQDLHVNLTDMPDERMVELVEQGLARINRKLELGLGRDQLVKTTMKRDVARRADLEPALARVH